MDKRSIYFLAVLFFFQITLKAQTWEWANSLGAANSNTKVNAISKYQGTDILVAGSFASSNLNLGSLTVRGAGQDDAFVAVADEDGNYRWATSIGGTDKEFAKAIASDQHGNIYVAGDFSSLSLTIGNHTLTNHGDSDGFLVKYNSDKSVAWARRLGNAYKDEITGLAIDNYGNVYVTKQNASPHGNVFLIKISSDNKLIWEQFATSTYSSANITSLAIDENQNIYVGGSFSDTIAFAGSNRLTSIKYLKTGFIAKFNSTGIYVHGIADTSINFNSMVTSGNRLYVSGDKINYHIGWGWPLADSKIFVAKFDDNLNKLWQKSVRQLDNPSLDIAKDITVDENGNAYVTGYFFSGTILFANENLVNEFHSGYYYPQVFIIKYSPNGEELWGKSFGGQYIDEGNSIMALSSEKFYVAGTFESASINFGNHTLNNTSKIESRYVHMMPERYGRSPNGFLAKYDGLFMSTSQQTTIDAFKSIYPNPIKDSFVITFKDGIAEKVSISIQSPDGRLVKRLNYKVAGSTVIVDSEELLPGVYFVSIDINGDVYTQKLVKN